MNKRKRKYIIYSVIVLLIVSLSVGFSALQRQLLIDDSIFNVRLQTDTRVSSSVVSKTGGEAISNYEEFNVSKVYGNVTFPTTSSYVLYKIDLTNYGNVKTGLLSITSNTDGVNYQICDSNGSNCSSNPKTSVCNGNNCTLGATKELYVKVTSNSAGTKNVDLDLDFEPYHTITYDNFRENTSSFASEIMQNDSYEVTLTSDPEEVSVSGGGNASYNKNTNKLTISGVTGNITVTAKYLITDVADTSYTGNNPNNYVSFNNALYRIVTKENINDGYNNTELRAKIISNVSIGNNQFDTTSNEFGASSIKDVLNTTYYGTLSNEAKELTDTAAWTNSYTGIVGLINATDFTNNSSWLFENGYTITQGENGTIQAVVSGSLTDSSVTITRATYPTIYLNKDVLVVGGSGTSTDPYLLELKSDGLQSNPTIVSGKTVTSNGNNQDMVEITNKVGTVYIGTVRLNESNYSSSGSTTIPQKKAVGTYTYYYYIPEIPGYKAKSGSVTSRINGITYTVHYSKGDNIASIGTTSDTCTTTGTSLTCDVTLPTITPNSGWENPKWSDGTNQYNPGNTLTLNSTNNETTLTSSVTGKTYTATIYYYNGTSVASTTRTCNVTNGTSCDFTVPSAVSNSTGVYDSEYKGIASTTNTMESATLSLSDNATFYAIYSTSVTNYYRGSSSYTSRTIYRNEYFTSNSAMTARLAATNDSTTNYSGGPGVGNSTWLGLSTTNDTTIEYNSTAEAATSTANLLYTVYQFSISYQKGAHVSAIGATGDTCKVTDQTSCDVTLPSITPNTGYTSVGWSETSGATTGVTGTYTINTNNTTLYANAEGSTYTATFYYYDGSAINTETSTCTVANVEGTCTVTIPVAVQSSTGPNNSAYKGVSASTSTMEAGSLVINNNTTKFYANYSSPVTRYYYNSGYKSGTIYRNEYFLNDTTMSSVLNGSNEGTTNYTSSRGPGSSNWLGLSTAQDTTPEYNSVSDAANSSATTFYTVYQFVLNYEAGLNVDSIGSDSATCEVTTDDTSCTVILPSITADYGYISVGWSLTNGDTTGDAPLTPYTITNNNRVLYANAIAANYINTTTNAAYQTLADAFTAVASNQTIKALQNVTETTTATLASSKTGVKLDLNGKTISVNFNPASSSFIVNDGTLSIVSESNNGGTITGRQNYLIKNNGSLSVNGVTITSTYVTIYNYSTTSSLNVSGSSTVISSTADSDGKAVLNAGTLTMTSGSITSTAIAISNSKNVTISGGTVTSNHSDGNSSFHAIYNQSTGNVNISGTTQITSTNAYTIYNDGILTISSGTFSNNTSSSLSYVISNSSQLTITGGTFTGATGIDNYGTATISGSSTQITTTSSTGINNNGGTLTFSDATVSAVGIAINNEYYLENNVTHNATATITSGTISSSSEDAIVLSNYSTLTLGTNDSTVGTTSPLIQTTSSSNKCGVMSVAGGTVNFYDGVVKSSSGAGYAFASTTTTVPTNYAVHRTVSSGIESAILATANYRINTTNYNTLKEAFEYARSNDTIVTLNNTTETLTATLTSGKTGVKLDLAGHTINMTASDYGIYNYGSLEVYTSVSGGTLSGSCFYAILNRGTFYVSDDEETVALTSTQNDSGALIYNYFNSTVEVYSATINVSNSAIQNDGTATISGGSITGTGHVVIQNLSHTLNLGTTITAPEIAIDNDGTLYLSESTVTAGDEQNSDGYGIENSGTVYLQSNIINATNTGISNSGEAYVYGSQVFGKEYGIYNYYYAEVNYGRVTSYTTVIYNSGGTLTLGDNDNNGTYGVYADNPAEGVCKTDPVIELLTNPNSGGGGFSSDVVSAIYSLNGSTINFYDGIVISVGGQGTAFMEEDNASITYNTPTGYTIYIHGEYTEEAYLGVENYQNTTTNEKFHTLQDAFDHVVNNQTIKVIRNVTETTTATLESNKTGIKLDLNGKTITFNDYGYIYNYGTLDIYNTSSTTGIIDGNSYSTIYNYGTLTTNATSSTNPIIIRNASTNGNVLSNSLNKTTTLNSNTTITAISNPSSARYLISNNGSLIINGATLTSTASTSTNNNGIRLYNAAATVTMNSGTINTAGYAIYNNTSTSADAISIVNGTITSSNYYAIYNYAAGGVSISNGTITGTYGIYNRLTGAVTIAGGTITGTTRGLHNNGSGVVTIGTSGTPVSTTSPIIQTTGTSSNYGLYRAGGTINFYDGVIKSSSGTNYSIYGTVANTENGYVIYKSTTSGVESAYLTKQYTATFYYNSNTTSGGLTVTTATATCNVTSGSTCTVTVPSVVTNSVGKYNSAYNGVSTGFNMNNSSLAISENTTFYANYSGNVTNYYYNSGYTDRTLKRNEYFTSASEMATVLGADSTTTANYTPGGGPNSSAFAGFSTEGDTTTEYDIVALAATSNSTTLYTVYKYTATYLKGSGVSAIGANSGTCNITTGSTSCTVVLPSITPDTGYTSVGWNTTNGATTGTAALSTYTLSGNVTLYANAIAAKYMNTTTNESYQTLQEAFNAVANNQTIKVMVNVTETTSATLASDKTEIKLNLNGRTITLSNAMITNNGELDIYNSSSTNGTITGNYESVINNAGGLTLNGTSATNKVIINNTKNDSVAAAIVNKSDLTVNNNIQIISGYTGIANNFGGILTLEDGIVTGRISGINNQNEIIINGGDILGTTECGIDNRGMAIIRGGIISSSSGDGIYNDGYVEISEGSITGSSYGIYNESTASLTLGTNDSSVSTTDPLVESTYNYGVYIGGTFNFYDGIIKSSSGTGYAISGTVSNTPTGYGVYTEVNDGVESAYLKAYLEATFYYNSNTTSGSITVLTATATCLPESGQTSCTVTVPSVVSSSVGKYNSAYKGVSTSTSSMASSNLTISANTTYYANYSSALTIYYPNSSNGISNTSTVLYRNEYFTSTSAMTTRTCTSGTTTTQATSITLSNLKGTLSGITSTANNTTSYAVNDSTNTINKSATTFYAVTTASENATFKYNSNTTSGSLTVSTATQAVTSTYYCQSTSVLKTAHGTTTTVPSAVSNSVGKYNSAYRAVAAANSLTAVTTFTGGSTYYAVYATPVTESYYNNGYNTRTLSRNEYFTNATTMNTVLATANDSTSSASSYTTGPNSSAFVGYSNDSDSIVEYDDIAGATESSSTTLDSVYQYTVTYTVGANVSSIGATSGSCNMINSSTSCSVVLPSITPNIGYGSVGWSPTNGDTTGVSAFSTYIINGNRTLYANAILANYQNTRTYNIYSTLADAFDDINTHYYGDTIRVLKDTTETSSATLEQDAYLELNGKTITFTGNNNIFINRGSLCLQGPGTITGSPDYLIDVYMGELSVNDLGVTGMVNIINDNTSSSSSAIRSGGYSYLYIYDYTSIYGTIGIHNEGNMIIYDGDSIYISGETAIYNSPSISNQTIEVHSGYIAGCEIGINNAISQSYITIIDGTISSAGGLGVCSGGVVDDPEFDFKGGAKSGSTTFGIVNEGTLTIDDVTINNYDTGIANNSTATIDNCSITYTDIGIDNAGTLTMNDGTITATTTGIKTEEDSTTNIKGGTVSATTYGIYADSNVNIGIPGEGVSITSPEIKATGTSNSNGIYINGTLYFYDGIVRSSSGEGRSIQGVVSPASGYNLYQELNNGIESSYLVAKYMIVETGQVYNSLSNAFSNVSNNQTIRVMSDVVDGSSTLGTGKAGIKLDLNGHTISINGSTITNNGELDIYNSSSTDGKITGGTTSSLINNNGVLTLNGTSTTNKTILEKTQGANVTNFVINVDSSSTLTINDNAYVQTSANMGVGIKNSGTTTLNGGTISSIVGMQQLGTFTMNSGTISATNGGYLQTAGTSTILGGTVTGSAGITLSGGTLILGDNQEPISTSSPVIEATGTSNSKGINISSSGVFNFYDGIVVSASGTDKAINGTVSSIPSGYSVVKETNDGVESAYLKAPYTATFYYNSNTTSGQLTVATATSQCLSATSCTVTIPSVVTNSVGKYNSAYKGVSNSLGNMNSSTLEISGDTTFYANYSSSVTDYYYNNSYTNQTLYRNEYFVDVYEEEMNAVLGTSNSTLTNITVSGGPNSSTFAGFSDSQNASIEYADVEAAAASSSNTLYTVYKYTVTYAIGANVSSIGSQTGSCNFTTSDTTCGVVLPSIIPDTDYNSVGWNTITNADTGTASGSIYFLTTNNTTLYANAVQGILMGGTNGDETTTFLRTQVTKQYIESITFTNDKTGHYPDGAECWDVSESENGSVLAWVEDSDNDGLYEMTIGSNGLVYASTGENLFLSLTNLTHIYNMEYFDTSNVTSMRNMFRNCTSLTDVDLSNFDTSKVTDMYCMFHSCSSLTTLDLSYFDTSSVQSMHGLFRNCTNLVTIYGLDTFDTSKVTTMQRMFADCSSISNISDVANFDTSKVTNMQAMFWNCPNLTNFSALADWDTSKVEDMNCMFGMGPSLNKNNNAIVDFSALSTWNVSNVTDMSTMFQNVNIASYAPFTTWNVGNVESFNNTFNQTSYSVVTSLHGLENWNVSSATDMTNMFHENVSLTDASAVTNWNVSNVVDMNGIFSSNSSLTTIDLSGWNTSSVQVMSNMFKNDPSLVTIYVGSSFVTTLVTSSTDMFTGCTSIKGGAGTTYSSSFIDKTRAHLDGGTSNPGYFSGHGGTLAVGNDGQDNFFNSSPILKTTVESFTFQPYINGPTGYIGGWDASYEQNGSVMAYYKDADNDGLYEVSLQSNGTIFAPQSSTWLFSYFLNLESINGMQYFDTSRVTDMRYMFGFSIKLTTLDLTYFDTSNVNNMNHMFSSLSTVGDMSLTSIIGIESLDTHNVVNFQCMFQRCVGLTTLNLSAWNTSKVTNMNNMFFGCTGLTSLNISNFDTSKVTTMQGMFYNCKKLTTLNITHFDTSSVENMQGMFQHCEKLTSLDLSQFSTASATNMKIMFAQCSELVTLDLSTFDTSNVTDMQEMFNGCTSLKTVYVNNTFVTTAVTESTNMFKNCNVIEGGMGTTLNGSYLDKTYARIDAAGIPGYFTGKNSLIATFYYNSNITSGELTVSTAHVSCTPATGQSTCLVVVPPIVMGSVGKYNSAYNGVSTSTSSMANSSLIINANKNFYANYSSSITIYYPTSTNTRSSYAYARNEYFTSTTAMNSVINSGTTSTSNFTFSSSVSGYSLYGFADNYGTNSRNYSSVSELAQTDKSTSYAVIRKAISGTIYYNSNTTSGSLTVATATASANQYIRCTSSAAEINNKNYTIPTAVTSSVGKYNSTYKGVTTSLNSMATATPTAANTVFYAVYSTSVTNYYYNSGYTNRTLYRNEYFSSTSAMQARLATSNSSTSNYSTAAGPGSSVWSGLSTAADTTAEYASVAAAATSNAATLYTVYQLNVTYAKGANVSAIGATSGSCKVTTSNTSCSVTLPSITPNTDYTSVGWSTINGATSGTSAGGSKSISSNGTTLYANAVGTKYTITLNNHGATSSGTTAVYEKYNVGVYLDSALTKKMTTSANAITVPTKGGYAFLGYFTAASGGTKMINANGYITSAFTSTYYNGAATLHAQWDPVCSVDYYKNCPEASLAYPTGSTYVYSRTSGSLTSNPPTYAEGILYMNNNSVNKVYYIGPAENGFAQLVVVHNSYCSGFGQYVYYTTAGQTNLGCNSANIRDWGFELNKQDHYTLEPAYIAYMASGCVTFSGNSNFTFNCSSNKPSSYSGGGSTPRYCYRCAVPPNAIWYQWATSNPGSNYCTQVSSNYCN